jgi:alkylation response protein AidB-like acyl-CoA dehydrogenase
MPITLNARTPAGVALVALAERLAGDLADCAPAHDRNRTYPFEGIAALRRVGYFGAPVSEELGGLGVDSLHDLVVASSRLARGDVSLAIGVNMHMAVLGNVVRRHRRAVQEGDARRAAAFARTLEQVTRDGAIIATAVSEPGQDLTRPATTALRTETGWRVDGRKIFCTMAPAATILFTTVSFVEDGEEKYGFARIPADARGVTVHPDWDALGMRASGSNSITFDGVQLPASALRGGLPAGTAAPYMEANLTAGLFHASASLGIADAAYEAATLPVAARPESAVDARAQMLVAEGAITLGAARAVLSRAATLVEEHLDGAPCAAADEELAVVFAEVQAAKAFINEAAVSIVDGALSLSGGAGYRNDHPLARAYRDVRAGAFMHPLGANRAYEFIGQVTLGREPSLH